MTRKKLNLSFIPNDCTRKTTFTKRKKGIMKKMHELSVLCGIEACVIINSPFIPTPGMWPTASGVNNTIEKFLQLPEAEQRKKMVNHETFLQQNIDKIKETNMKRMKDNSERTMKEAMFQFLAGKGDMLKLTDRNRIDLIQFIRQYLKELYHHRDHTLKQPRFEQGESSSAANAMTPPRATTEVGSSSLVPGTIAQVGSSSFPFGNVLAPPRAPPELGSSSFSFANFIAPPEVGSSSFTFSNVMAPPMATPEVGSSSFQNRGVLTGPPLSDDLWAMMRSMNSLDPKPEQVNNMLAANFMPTSNDLLGYYLLMNQAGVFDQLPNFNPNQYQPQQQFNYPPAMDQDGMYYLNQNTNHQQFGYPQVVGNQDGMTISTQQVDQTMNNPQQMGFDTMKDNKQYYPQ